MCLSEELYILTSEQHKVSVVTSSWSKRNATKLRILGEKLITFAYPHRASLFFLFFNNSVKKSTDFNFTTS